MISILVRFTALITATLVVLAGMSFSLAYLFPGDVLVNLSGVTPESDQIRQIMANQYHLDQPYLIQFYYYLLMLAQGDWGYSFSSGQLLVEDISVALPATLELSTYATLLALTIGIPTGCYMGFRAYSNTDVSINSLSLISYSFPVYWLAMLFILIFSLQLGVAPLSGRIDLLFDIPSITGFILVDIMLAENIDTQLAFNDALRHMVLPTLSIAILTTAAIIRLTRRSVIDVMQKPFIAAAYSRGMSHWGVFWHHVARNALLPILPLFAIQLTTLITNAMIVETLFSWPGIGNWLIQSIYQRDYPALRVGMFALSAVVVILTLLIDLISRLIDPRRDNSHRGRI